MIKTIAIHKLFDFALDTLFNAIYNNFYKNKQLVIGTTYNSISITRITESGLTHIENYRNCVITHIYKGKYFGTPVTLFNFSTNDGDIIMGCTLYDALIE